MFLYFILTNLYLKIKNFLFNLYRIYHVYIINQISNLSFIPMSTDPPPINPPHQHSNQPQQHYQSQNKIPPNAYKSQKKQFQIRHPKISFKIDQNKQQYGNGRSISIKNKLDLQNTRLKINIQNLSTLITIHQNNQNKLKQQLQRYKDKVIKYKQKIKQKDNIIGKLLEKLQKRMQIDGINIENLLVKLHEQYLNGFKYKLGKGQNLEINQVVGKYEELLKGFRNQEKQRIYLEKQKQELEKTIVELRETIKHVGQEKETKDNKNKMENKEISMLRTKLQQVQYQLQKEKAVRNYLMDNLRQQNIQIMPELNTKINQIQRNRSSLSSRQINSQSKDIQNKLNEQLSILRQKFAQSQTNLYSEREKNKATQKHCNKIQGQLSVLSQKIIKSNTAIETLQNRILKIQQIYSTQLQQLQQKTNLLIQDSTTLQRYKTQVEQTSKKLSQAIKKFSQQSTQWTKLQNKYQNRIDQMRNKAMLLQDQLQKQKQKRKIFQLKIMSEDQQNKGKEDIRNQTNDKKQKYLDQRIQGIVKQSLKNRRQNQLLTQQLNRNKRGYEILQNQLKIAEQRIYQLTQHFKQNQNAEQPKHRKSQPINQSSQSTQQQFQTQQQPSQQIPAQQKTKQNILKQIDYLNLSQLQNKFIQLVNQNNYLQNQISQLRNKCIDMQINYQNIKRQVQNSQHQDVNRVEGAGNNNQTNEANRDNKNKILGRGQNHVQKNLIQEPYQINIINPNDLPKDIQQMSFQQLATRYLAIREQNQFIKQKFELHQNHKPYIPQPNPSTSNQQKHPNHNRYILQNNLQMILSQNQPQQSNSQQIDDDTYKNINEQIDRLIIKNKQLQNQLTVQKNNYQSQIKTTQYINNQLKQKLKSAQEINTNLSNIVVHLQSQLSRYQNNQDNSMQEQRGSSILQASSKKQRQSFNDFGSTQLGNKILEKKRQFQQILKESMNIKDKKSGQYDNKLRILQQQIRQLQQQRKKPSQEKRVPQKQSNILQQKQCTNCQSLLKINTDLIKKLTTMQQNMQAKNLSYKKILQELQNQVQELQNQVNAADNTSVQILLDQNKKLRHILAEIKSQAEYYAVQNQNQENQIKNLHEINQQLVTSIHEKQKLLLKLKTDAIRQNFQKEGLDPQENQKIQEIFENYERKIEELQNIIKGQQKTEVNVSDLYETINYLNGECQNLRKILQASPQNKQILTKQNLQTSQTSVSIPKPSNIQTPITQIPHKQLIQKYNQLVNVLSNIQKYAIQNNYSSIEQVLQNIQKIQQQNILLMKQINRLQNKIQSINIKNQQYFKKINEGKIYQIIQNKDKQLDDIKDENKKVMGQLQNLARERHSMFLENQKINQDLKNIQQNIQKLTGQKLSLGESTLANRSLQRNNANLSIQKDAPISKYTPQQSQYILTNISRKLQILKSTIMESSHKNRPNFEIQSFQQIPTLEDIIIILLERVHFAWNLIQQRTNQYNQLRDQMNIISMQCMKNAQLQPEVFDKSRESQNKKYTQVIEQRYEQVLAQLVQYQNQNKRLQKEVTRLKQQINNYKKQVQDIQSKYISEIKSQSSQELPYNQYLLNKMLESNSSVGSNSQQQMPEIIKLFLARIKQLQENLQSIQMEFDEKNKKLENLIQKQKSFLSEKSRAQKSDQSQASLSRQRQPLSEREKIQNNTQSKNIISPTITQNIIDEKSYSLNSARVFKQIQQLTKANQQLREKKLKYKGILEKFVNIIEKLFIKSNLPLDISTKEELEKIIASVNGEIEEQAKKENDGFDLDNDIILSSSLAPKGYRNLSTSGGNLQQVKNTFEQAKLSESFQKNKKKQPEIQKKTKQNLNFLQQNKFLLEDLLNKLFKLQKIQLSIQEIKQKLAQKLSDKQLQQILYISEPDQAILRILEIISQPFKKSTESNDKNQNQNQNSIQEGEWVQTEQLQAIINRIYPIKSQLCLIVANSINMLMLAQTKQGILKAVQFLFSNLKNKQTQLRQQSKRRDQSVAQYGKKLQKLLINKYSDQDSQQKSQLLNQNSLRKTIQFKTQYQIKKQQEKDKQSQSNSQSYSSSFSYQ